MTALAPHLTTFLREHLPHERRASPHTSAAYAYSFQLLLCFAAARLRISPSGIEIEQFDPSLILAFLEHIEEGRGNSARTRNVRLAAIKAFFRFLEYRLPSCLDQARRIRAIPMKKVDETLVGHLNRDEMQALLDAPDPRRVSGIRDRAMLHLAFAAGLRVSELVSLRIDQIDRQTVASIHVMGKGRRERVLPLWKETAMALKAWLVVRPASGDAELFLNATGRAMTRSGFEYILTKHVATAARKQPSIADKRVTPHVLRHTCAMHTLRATRDVRKVSLWLGHASLQSTEIYLRADPTEKLEALAAMAPPSLKPGRFRSVFFMARAAQPCSKWRMDIAALSKENASLKALLAKTQAALAQSEEARRRLESIVGDLQREKFGAKSEKLSPEQYNLPLEDVEIAQGVLDAAQEKADAIINGKAGSEVHPRKSNRGRLPSHLPRVERTIEPESTLCPCGCGEMTKIGEDASERLDVIPAQFRVLVTRRPKYACRRCSGAVVQAHAPEHVVPGGLPTEALIAQVVVSKFGDHVPFYRQADIYTRQGIKLDRATLGNWAGRACFHLQPIADHMRQHLAVADR